MFEGVVNNIYPSCLHFVIKRCGKATLEGLNQHFQIKSSVNQVSVNEVIKYCGCLTKREGFTQTAWLNFRCKARQFGILFVSVALEGLVVCTDQDKVSFLCILNTRHGQLSWQVNTGHFLSLAIYICLLVNVNKSVLSFFISVKFGLNLAKYCVVAFARFCSCVIPSVRRM